MNKIYVDTCIFKTILKNTYLHIDSNSKFGPKASENYLVQIMARWWQTISYNLNQYWQNAGHPGTKKLNKILSVEMFL